MSRDPALSPSQPPRLYSAPVATAHPSASFSAMFVSLEVKILLGFQMSKAFLENDGLFRA